MDVGKYVALKGRENLFLFFCFSKIVFFIGRDVALKGGEKACSLNDQSPAALAMFGHGFGHLGMGSEIRI